jgi:YidC/Oxa1 family membrane protein insertase
LAEFKNPQQDPGMERRLLLVFGLTFLVIILSQPLLKKYLPQSPAAPAQSQPTAQPFPAVNPPASPVAMSAATTSTAKQATTESETVVENGLYRVTFTNRGAQVKSWILKKFNDDQGKPLDLVNHSAEKFGHPLSLWSYDEGLRNRLNSVLYVAPQEGTKQAPTEISFEFADADLSVRKTFSFDNTYVLHISTLVIYKGSQVTAFPLWPAGFGDAIDPPTYGYSQFEYQNNNSTERLAIKKISSGNTVRGPFNWAGVTDRHFAAVFIPEVPDNAAVVTLRNMLEIPKNRLNPNPQEVDKVEVLGTAVGDLTGPTAERMYVGPKSLQVLEAVHLPTVTGASPDLRALINFGFFSPIARPLFFWLKWTYAKIVPNWGWAIVIQTLIINLALLPLRIYQMKSALKMQKIQPQMKAIQEKYKKYGMRDPKKQDMQKEIWELQQREGVNMFSGCLPMIIQLPFLFAYYSMLGAAIELRQAHWLWIHDLSATDPWHVLPAVLVLSMIVTQRMMPQPGVDPAQQKMMNLMMPLMMGFIFYNLAAGLSLYYAEGNLISIAQQAIMNRTRLGQEMRELAAKRARKKDK